MVVEASKACLVLLTGMRNTSVMLGFDSQRPGLERSLVLPCSHRLIGARGSQTHFVSPP